MEGRFIRHGKKKAPKIYICIGVRGILFEITLEYRRDKQLIVLFENVLSGQLIITKSLCQTLQIKVQVCRSEKCHTQRLLFN